MKHYFLALAFVATTASAQYVVYEPTPYYNSNPYQTNKTEKEKHYTVLNGMDADGHRVDLRVDENNVVIEYFDRYKGKEWFACSSSIYKLNTHDKMYEYFSYYTIINGRTIYIL